MTIDEAIRHAEEVAEEMQKRGISIKTHWNGDTEKSKECYKCAEEHRQLAEWLKELKQLRQFKDSMKAIDVMLDLAFEEVNKNDT